MNNLRKFATEADYSAATLNYPAVSWVVSGDTVHYDKEAPTPTVNDKVMLYSHTESPSEDLVLYNGASSPSEPYFTSITVNDTEVENPNSTNVLEDVGTGTYLIKYSLTSNEIDEWFSGDIGGFGSGAQSAEVLIPAQITAVDYLPDNMYNLVIEATTPPDFQANSSGYVWEGNLYVPDESVNTYKQTYPYNQSTNKILPISEYSGNLPV